MTGRSTGPALTFFNDHEARTVEAVACRVIPGDADDPGAREVGATTYIDGALGGFYRDLQTLYRRGLEALDRRSRDLHGAPFASLTDDKQDAVLADLDGPLQPEKTTDQALLVEFFAVVRQHTIEGTFCDPLYGGNRDGKGWRLIGFPGAHWGYPAAQMKPGFDAAQIPISTLDDLRRLQAPGPKAKEGRG